MRKTFYEYSKLSNEGKKSYHCFVYLLYNNLLKISVKLELFVI
jgi:hypothetical protein